MVQLTIAIFGFWLAISYAVLNNRAAEARYVALDGEIAAASFQSYRFSVAKRWYEDTSATGTIPDSLLVWESGYIRDSRWTNVVAGGTLYVYSTAPVTDSNLVGSAYQKSGRNVLVGTKSADGSLASAGGWVIPAALPGAIPTGSLVQIGG